MRSKLSASPRSIPDAIIPSRDFERVEEQTLGQRRPAVLFGQGVGDDHFMCVTGPRRRSG